MCHDNDNVTCHVKCHYFNFNLVPRFVILIQFNSIFLKLDNFVPPQIETKFNFDINVILIFLLKLIFLLNLFNKIKFIYFIFYIEVYLKFILKYIFYIELYLY